MAKTLIGNIKGNDGRGISKIEKTATTGDVDTYTITYTDSTTSTYDVRNGDTIAIQRQIVPSAKIESSTTATQSYGVGDYLILNGTLRKVTAPIANGNQITDSNSKSTTVVEELTPAEVTGSATSTSVSGNAAFDHCEWRKRGNLVYVEFVAKSTGPIAAGSSVTVSLSGMPSGINNARSVGWSGSSIFVFDIGETSCLCKVMASGIGSGVNMGANFVAYCD